MEVVGIDVLVMVHAAGLPIEVVKSSEGLANYNLLVLVE
jgi:hypothetical protein